MVFLHHAIAGWPAWEGYAEIVGGRFHYQPATLDGIDYPDSGYRHDVTHTVEVLDPTHPICAGIDPTVHHHRRGLPVPGARGSGASR